MRIHPLLPLFPFIAITLSACLELPPKLEAPERATLEASAVATLDDFHDAASKADFARYFGHFDQDAVFLGTDATERWTRAQFEEYVRPHFSQGHGWTYKPTERHVTIASDGRYAWFDERLANEKYGDTRGSGVLVRRGKEWKLAQYNLTIPMPNALAEGFVREIRSSQK